MAGSLDKSSRIVIIGAGVFGLTTAYQLASEGYSNIIVLDRHVPPVPDGSSVDISRVIRFDYADSTYLQIAYDAYKKWSTLTKYKDIFFPSPFILSTSSNGADGDSYIKQCTAALTERGLPWASMETAEVARQTYPTLTGPLAQPGFFGYTNTQAGWADAQKAINQLRDDCLELGVSFICGRAGTVVDIENADDGRVKAVRTLQDTKVEGDLFVLSAGAWSSSLVPFRKSTLSTAQVIGYMRLTDEEMVRYKTLPICINFSTGWFNFPPHPETKMLKMAIHGWGYTRSPISEERRILEAVDVSTPPLKPPRERANGVPVDGEERLRNGLREILPELGDRPFDRTALCWYTDTPTGDFIMDYHPDHSNLFVAGGGSGHAFKFLPVLGEYTARGILGNLSAQLKTKWRFRDDLASNVDAFAGDGSRGGPVRRELPREGHTSKL